MKSIGKKHYLIFFLKHEAAEVHSTLNAKKEKRR